MTLTLGLAIAYTSTLCMALFPILVGSLLSLRQEKKTETLTWESAWAFPFIGSGVLFGLYVLFKYLPAEYINFVMSTYFILFGIGAVTLTISQAIEYVILAVSPPPPPSSSTSDNNEIPKIPNQKNSILTKNILTIPAIWQFEQQNFTLIELIGLVLAISIALWYGFTKHWVANNIFGMSFCIQAIAMFSMGSYKIGCTLLCGLFFYDIFWVFGTDVMITVAKSFDAPIKLVFPRDIFAEVYQFSMLGLGDIVIPGFFIALLLRFDHQNTPAANKKPAATPYFRNTFLAYFLGLLTCFAVMHYFKHGQPALLYLVPFCIGGSILTALQRGEIKALWNYSEEEEETKPEDAKTVTSDTNNNNTIANTTVTKQETTVVSETTIVAETKKDQ